MKISQKIAQSALVGLVALSALAVFPSVAFAAKTNNNAAVEASKSKEPWKDGVKAPAGAPNVVWILLDDVGYGAISTFGGLIETPNLTALADNGLRYTNFHTTAISSPTRAALLTGRNHHSVGMGLFPETAIDQPGYHARIPFSKALAPEVLQQNGYATFAVGKWHITPVDEATAAGPFTRWPTGRGFDQYYGFLYGETDQWHPQLVDGTHRVDAPAGEHFGKLITDRAIANIDNQKSIHPDQPFFLYYASGAAHAPHQVSQEWIQKYKGKFDGGWDKYRQEVFENQKKNGLIPANAKLAPRNPNIKDWNTLSADEKRLFARYFEAYAGFLSYTDAQIGRLVQHLKDIGQFENTIFAVVVGDNGGSKEGTDIGTINGLGDAFGNKSGLERALKNIDQIGTEYSSPNYPLGWAQAVNVPYKHWKQDANSEGGTRNPLILSWAKGIQERGVREQYGHVIDLLPTTLELAHLNAPAQIKGVKQDPFEGTSLAYSVNNAKAASKHTVQYYEINGTRSIYKDGWKAATLHKVGTPFDQDVWELYNISEDPTELNDLAASNPAKLKELKALFESEGKKYNVFPLKDNLFKAFGSDNSAFKGQKQISLLPGIQQIFSPSAPNVASRAHTLSAVVNYKLGDQGVIFANGGRFGGSSLFIRDGKLSYAITDGVKSSVITSQNSLNSGAKEVAVKFAPQGLTSANVSLWADGQKIGEGSVPLVFGQGYFAYDEGFDVGQDLQTPVSDLYNTPNKYNGDFKKVTIQYE